MMANAPSTIAHVPEIVPVKYNTAMLIAISKRMILSADPMFFFIIVDIYLSLK